MYVFTQIPIGEFTVLVQPKQPHYRNIRNTSIQYTHACDHLCYQTLWDWFIQLWRGMLYLKGTCHQCTPSARNDLLEWVVYLMLYLGYWTASELIVFANISSPLCYILLMLRKKGWDKEQHQHLHPHQPRKRLCWWTLSFTCTPTCPAFISFGLELN